MSERSLLDGDDLLPEGKLLRVNRWGVTGLRIIAGVMGIAAALSLLASPKNGSHDGVQYVVAASYLLFGLLCLRVTQMGLCPEANGILVRTFWSKHRWRWPELAEFSLRGTVYRPNLRIVLRDGTIRTAGGLEARSADERERAERFVNALNRRLAEE